MLWFVLKSYLIFTFFWALLVLYFREKFFRSFSHLSDPEVQSSKAYHCYTRNDYPRWDKTQMTLVAIFLLPTRVLGFGFVFVGGSLLLRLVFYLYKKPLDSEEKPIELQTLSLKIIRNVVRISCFIIGIYETNEPIIVKISPEKYPKLRFVKPPQSAPIAISNHVAAYDILYYLTRDFVPEFVFKSSMLKVAVFNVYLRVLNCVPVYRSDPVLKEKTLEIIQNRIQSIEKKKIINPLMIFPEGTTTNGRNVMDFKKGAFEFLSPVRVSCLKYRSTNSDPAYVMVNGLNHIILNLLNLYNTVQCYELSHAMEPKEGVTWEEYAAEAKRIYVEEFGLGDGRNSFRDRIKFESEKCGFSAKDFE